MSTRKRLITGFGATAVGPLITAFTQLVSVPIFLRAWGPHLYGEWLILSAIPTYLSITDMGFGSVAGNDMTMRVKQGDYKGALETFQSTLLLVTGLSVAVALIAGLLLVAAPVSSLLHVSLISPADARLVLLLLSVYTLGTLQGSILISGFRAEGQYSFGVMGLNAIRLLENLFLLISLFLHAMPLQTALILASARVLGTGVLYRVLVRRLPWLQISFANATRQRIRELSRPAIAFMAFPAGNAISIQGLTVLIGILLGPVAVATFTPMRTLSRFAFQLIDSIKNTVWPELSAAFGARDWPLARKLHRSCCQVALWLALAAVAALAVTGPFIFRIWTNHKVQMDVRCFDVLLLVVVASSLWNTSSAVSIAASLHEDLAIKYLIGTCSGLVLAYFLIPYFSLTGAAVALLASDIWMSCFTLRASNTLLKENSNEFLRSMFDFSRVRLLMARS